MAGGADGGRMKELAKNGDEVEGLPCLPEISVDLESYFEIARQIETALIQEKRNSQKIRDELNSLKSELYRLKVSCSRANKALQEKELDRVKMGELEVLVQKQKSEKEILQARLQNVELANRQLKRDLESLKNQTVPTCTIDWN